MIPYQYAILRYIHDRSTGEFVNIGAVIWAPERQEFIFDINHRYGRVSSFFDGLNGKEFQKMVGALRSFFSEQSNRRKLKQMDLFESKTLRLPDILPTTLRLSDILPTLLRSGAGCFEWSNVMAGIGSSLEDELVSLIEDYVTKYEVSHIKSSTDEGVIWKSMDRLIKESHVDAIVERKVEVTASTNYQYTFHLGWQNGCAQYAEPISFDLKDASSIREKAVRWCGRLGVLRTTKEFRIIPVVAKPSNPRLNDAYGDALSILEGESTNSVRMCLEYEDAGDLVDVISADHTLH